eukprot:TRINITY_DN3316_c1_g1_i3.p1 TRINITY_DN3316_c1_g1~~TRINITY_DN3316_c1_g1_i3.p1  ORF type:complete len:287 (-),score=81.05 TRINITY_DN3316_c1_g1_i3:3-863(-)
MDLKGLDDGILRRDLPIPRRHSAEILSPFSEIPQSKTEDKEKEEGAFKKKGLIYPRSKEKEDLRFSRRSNTDHITDRATSQSPPTGKKTPKGPRTPPFISPDSPPDVGSGEEYFRPLSVLRGQTPPKIDGQEQEEKEEGEEGHGLEEDDESRENEESEEEETVRRTTKTHSLPQLQFHSHHTQHRSSLSPSRGERSDAWTDKEAQEMKETKEARDAREARELREKREEVHEEDYEAKRHLRIGLQPKKRTREEMCDSYTRGLEKISRFDELHAKGIKNTREDNRRQ